MLLLPLIQSHLTLLLAEGKVFDWLFRGVWLKGLRSCPMCLGFWTSLIVALPAGIYNPFEILGIAAAGHLIFLARDKYLPCDKCKIPEPISFRVINGTISAPEVDERKLGS